MTTLSNYLVCSAEQFSEHCAIELQNESISYQDLFTKSSMLSGFFSNYDTEINIAICLPKSFSLYYAIFGVLLSGNCYVPVSYQTPTNKLKYILADSDSNFIITTTKILSKHFPEYYIDTQTSHNETVIVKINSYPDKIEIITSIEKIFYSKSLPEFNKIVSPNTPCYLLYTSGSTGNPKGILHTHKSACAFVEWATDHLRLSHKDIVAHKSSICFDLSVFDIFATIKVGAKLAPIPDNYFNNGMLLINYIHKKNVTILYSVPSTLLNHLTEENLKKIKTSSLRHIIFAGEQLYSQFLLVLYSNLPMHCCLNNWYGPTETNVCSYFKITEDSFFTNKKIPIGTSCEFSKLSVDECNVLLIQSQGLMHSYWNQEKMSSTYYSGDIVSIDDTGNYYFEGRIDRQIKFRGYRLQPEEIEAVITTFPDVKESAVIINETEITAFISADIKNISHLSLLAFCQQHLESYMLPNRILNLVSIPRTYRGKIDYCVLSELSRNTHDN